MAWRVPFLLPWAWFCCVFVLSTSVRNLLLGCTPVEIYNLKVLVGLTGSPCKFLRCSRLFLQVLLGLVATLWNGTTSRLAAHSVAFICLLCSLGPQVHRDTKALKP